MGLHLRQIIRDNNSPQFSFRSRHPMPHPPLRSPHQYHPCPPLRRWSIHVPMSALHGQRQGAVVSQRQWRRAWYIWDSLGRKRAEHWTPRFLQKKKEQL